MRIALSGLAWLLLSACSAQQYPIVTRCEAPTGSKPIAHIILRDGEVVSAHDVEIPRGCRVIVEDDVPRLDAAYASTPCEGPSLDFTGWTVRKHAVENGGSSYRTVVESDRAIHLMQSSTSGGMPSGALEINEWLILIAPSPKAIEPCNTHTRLEPYSGPAPA